MEDRCIYCGEVIPEGYGQICPECLQALSEPPDGVPRGGEKKPDAVTDNGSPALPQKTEDGEDEK